MFAHLKRYTHIVVTGPPRSGTHITTKMIAHDTGHRYVDEEEYGIGRDEARWRRAVAQKNAVVHSPNLVGLCVDNPPADAFIVLVRRNIDDIHASQRRVMDEIGTHLNFGFQDRVLGAYVYWDTHEKKVPFAEVYYDTLANHPLWVPDHKRKDFRFDQTG